MGKSSPYPRGTPFKPPTDAPANPPAPPSQTADGVKAWLKEAAPPGEPSARDAQARDLLLQALDREARLRRSMLRLAIGTVVVVVALLGVGGFVFHRALQRIDSAQVYVAPPAPKAALPESRLAEKEKPAPLIPDANPPPGPREASLKALGGLTAGHLYQSYLNIGLLADAMENDLYKLDDAKKWLASVLSFMNKIDEQMARLDKEDLGPEEQKAVAGVRLVTDLLRIQGNELRGYWETPDTNPEKKEEHEKKYMKAREQAWDRIRELLGAKEE
jgi:hypothetical protein